MQLYTSPLMHAHKIAEGAEKKKVYALIREWWHFKSEPLFIAAGSCLCTTEHMSTLNTRNGGPSSCNRVAS